jgi:LemA protein
VRGLFTATAEAYPELKSSDLYLKTMKQLAEVEENVTASIRIYNSSVQEFNSAIQTFPGSFINRNVTRQVAVKEFTDAEAAKDFSYQPNL